MPKILGVDDSATMRRILEMTFAGDAGSQVTTVADGDAAVRWTSDNGADVVLADTSMSGTDGYEVARALRGNPATQGVAVIVLASQHHPYDAEKGRQCGVDDHVMKPFETQALIDKVRDVLGRARPSAAARPVAAAPAAAAAAPAMPPAPARPTAVGPGGPPRPPAAPAVPGVVSPPARPAAPAIAPAASRSTVAFGAPPGARPPSATTPSSAPAPSAPAASAPAAARPAAAPAAPAKKPALELADEDEAVTRAAPVPQVSRPAAPAAAAATAPHGEMAGKLSGMGLTPEQVDGVLALSREVIERVVWEVVPDLAETIIREEIRRLTSG